MVILVGKTALLRMLRIDLRKNCDLETERGIEPMSAIVFTIMWVVQYKNPVWRKIFITTPNLCESTNKCDIFPSWICYRSSLGWNRRFPSLLKQYWKLWNIRRRDKLCLVCCYILECLIIFLPNLTDRGQIFRNSVPICVWKTGQFVFASLFWQ